MEQLGKRSVAWLVALPLLALCLRLLELQTGTITTFYPIRSDMLARPWLFLLPLDIGDGASRWSTTGLVVVSLLNKAIGSNPTFCVLSVLSVLVASVASWMAFRSHVLSATMALCQAVGTQFSYSYINSSCVILYLYCMYVHINLLCLQRVWDGSSAARAWRGLFVASLVVTALSWEMWLDYAVFLLLLVGFGYVRQRGSPEPGKRRRLAFIAATVGLVGGAFLLGKLLLGGAAEHLRPGREAELVFNYFPFSPFGAAIALSAEDIWTNAFTFNYIAITNFLPPGLVASNSLQLLGRERLVLSQSGYWPQGNELVYMHHVFLWYFAAGMASLMLYYALVRCARASRTRLDASLFAAFLLLVVTGAFTHLFIKFRFYNSVPLYSYKCITSIIGVALLMAYGLKAAYERLGPRRGGILCAGAWAVISYAGLARPAFLTELSRPIGQANYPYPSAAANLKTLLLE